MIEAPKLVGPNPIDLMEGTGIYREGLEQERLIEQTEYLAGALYADKGLRMTLTEEQAKEIDFYGPGSAPFWRGLLEAGSSCCSLTAVGQRQYPRIELRGSYWLLAKFVTFLLDRAERENIQREFSGVMDLCSRNHLVFTGRKAQHVVRWLYDDAWVSQASARAKADDILRWR